MVADGVGLPLDDIETSFQKKMTTQTYEVAAGHIPKNTVGAQRWEWAGVKDGKKRVVHETIWRIHDSMADKWPRGSHSIRINGDPNMYLEFGGSWNDNPRSTTTMHAVNSIPTACDASCGIQTFLDLPWIVGRGAAQ